VTCRLDQLSADLKGPFTLVLIEPVADLVSRPRRFGYAQPVLTGIVAGLRHDLYHVAITQLVAQGNNSSVTLAPIQVCPTSVWIAYAKSMALASCGRMTTPAFGSKRYKPLPDKDPPSGWKEIRWDLYVLLPLDYLAQPGEPLFVFRGDRAVPSLYFQWAAMPSSAILCISSVRICTSN